MPKISIPSHFSTDLYNVLRAIIDAIETQEIQVGSVDTARNLTEGNFALIPEDGKAYLYAKLRGALYRVELEKVVENRRRVVYNVPGLVEQPPLRQVPQNAEEVVDPPPIPDPPPDPPEPPEPTGPGPS